MSDQTLSNEEVSIVHAMRTNPFFRQMIENVVKEYCTVADAEKKEA